MAIIIVVITIKDMPHNDRTSKGDSFSALRDSTGFVLLGIIKHITTKMRAINPQTNTNQPKVTECKMLSNSVIMVNNIAHTIEADKKEFRQQDRFPSSSFPNLLFWIKNRRTKDNRGTIIAIIKTSRKFYKILNIKEYFRLKF